VETARFSYRLPRDLIAKYPLPRGTSRLLVVDRRSGDLDHRRFSDIITYLNPGDVLVLNDTRVIRARLYGKKETGGAAEVFLLRELGPARWSCLIRTSKRMRTGMRVVFDGNLSACVEECAGNGYVVSLSDPVRILEQGKMPLPPYLERDAEESDVQTYQTVYARHDGSVAAPTAGLHFTMEMLAGISSRGVSVVPVTLQVGTGTFLPVRAERVEDHVMHAEDYAVEKDAARIIEEARRERRRIVAVGTTVTRVLEHLMRVYGRIEPGKGSTDIFIHDGFPFQAVGAMLTNFHLPCSTLLMLACAFGGHELTMKAYEEAIRKRYRFFSYGDAMLII